MEKIKVRICQDNPERNIFKTVYIDRLLHSDEEFMWIKWRGYRWRVAPVTHSDVYEILYML